MTAEHAGRSAGPPDLFDEARDRGIITPEQADQLRDLAAATPPPPPPSEAQDVSDDDTGPSLAHIGTRIAEALGYVGAALAIVAGVFIAQQFWADLTPWSQTSLLGVVAIALLGAGAAVNGPIGTPTGRLGSFLWVLAAGATAATFSVYASEVANVTDNDMALWVTAPATILAAVLWRLRERALQLMTVTFGIAGVSMAILAQVDDTVVTWGGLLIWALGIAWMLLAYARVLTPLRAALVLGALGALAGPLFMFDDNWALWLGLGTAVALIVIGIGKGITALGGMAVVALFVYIPRIVFEYVGDGLAAVVAMLLVGIVLVAVAVIMATRRPDTEGGAS
jgi:hypothetical protein